MSDDSTHAKTPLEEAADQVRDLFVYAPIGLLFEGPALLPTLIERGRNQVATARMIGQFAVQQGQAEIGKNVAKLGEQAGSNLDGLFSLLGLTHQDAGGATTAGAAAADVAPEPAATPQPRPTSGDTSRLAIPDYDSLSASQVVNRLAGLAADELEAVREYETAHRGRKTILNKIAQLQA